MEKRIQEFITINNDIPMAHVYDFELKQHAIFFDCDDSVFVKRFVKFFTQEEIYDIFASYDKAKVKELRR